MLRNIYCKDLQSLVQKIFQPNPEDIYIFIPPNFKPTSDAESKIIKIIESEKPCFVYTDIEVYKNNKVVPQLFPSYNMNHNLVVNLPIYINTDKPVFINAKTPEDVLGQIWKQIAGYHIPELLFQCNV